MRLYIKDRPQIISLLLFKEYCFFDMSLKRKAPSSDGNLNADFCQALIELAEWEKNVNRKELKLII